MIPEDALPEEQIVQLPAAGVWGKYQRIDAGYLGEAPDMPHPASGIPLATQFRLPMANLEKAWYEAAHLGAYNYHPERCEDWNLETLGNTDLGEPLVAPFTGLVLAAANYGGGVGRVVQILGRMEDGTLVVWGGWHLHEISVRPGQIVQMGDAIGSIGNADGRYAGAHLHEQICIVNAAGIPGPTVFASDARYAWQQPDRFYLAHGVDAALIKRVTAMDGA